MSAKDSASSFSEVYTGYRHSIYSYVLYRTNFDHHAAEDLTSDIFLKAYNNFNSYNPTYAMSTWLYTIARNTLTDYYRTARPTDTIDVDSLPNEIDPLFGLLLLENISEHDLSAALAKLTPEQHRCITAKFWEKQNAREIAETLNLSHDAVRKHLSRGIATLRESLISIMILGLWFNTLWL